MEIIHNKKRGGGYFAATDDGLEVGEASYMTGDDDCLIIDHVGVDPRYRGQGLGKKIVEGAVEYARDNNVKIIPVCPFARRFFEINPNMSDVL